MIVSRSTTAVPRLTGGRPSKEILIIEATIRNPIFMFGGAPQAHVELRSFLAITCAKPRLPPKGDGINYSLLSYFFLDTWRISWYDESPDSLHYGRPYMNRAEAESLLRQMLGADKSFRDGQWEAIETAAVRKQRVLVVQRTGWGKSMTRANC